jgi:hypothetical protein
MINVSTICGLEDKYPKTEDKTGGYDQPEDAYDWFMHNNEEVKEFVNKNKLLKDYCSKSGNDMRELWDVEVFAFNKWIGEKVCHVDYNMKKESMAEILNSGKAFVTGLKHVYSHIISVVGAELFCNAEGEIKISEEDKIVKPDLSNVLNILIADSYGDVNEDYKTRKSDVWMNRVERDKLLKYINKSASSELFYGIVFDV